MTPTITAFERSPRGHGQDANGCSRSPVRTSPSRSRSRPAEMTSQRPSVSPVLPLLLLETMRDRDRPEEVLEEEDITLSLPRRIGLSEGVRASAPTRGEPPRPTSSVVVARLFDADIALVRRAVHPSRPSDF